ncbi:MAG: SDR family NAD(P)-dependent oxidoreductase, partial [Acidobacteria bacterium]|nr:SDR family NAD(P)-dependent oxidoreductase [Acidobacteriota bacterium]
MAPHQGRSRERNIEQSRPERVRRLRVVRPGRPAAVVGMIFSVAAIWAKSETGCPGSAGIEKESRIMEFDGKVAIVTGGGRGIGEATCHGFARQGAVVIVADSDEVGGRKTTQAIQASGGTGFFVKTDVRVSAEVERMAQQAVAQFRRVDVLANVAGVQGMVANVVDLPLEEWDRVVAVNLTGTYLCCKHCIPAMLQNGGGSIVNVASLQSYFNVPGS